ncbi:MAG: ribonuclease HI family protein [Actinomycetota bacterium]
MPATLYADGGARGNPGPAAIGVVLRDSEGAELDTISRTIGETTNNVAEYTAVIEGLKLAQERGVTDLEVKLDSKLVVHQLNGDWKIKSDALRGLAVEAKRLLNRFRSAKLEHVARGRNSDADKLVNQALDAAQLEDLGPQWVPPDEEDDGRPKPGPGQTSLLD